MVWWKHRGVKLAAGLMVVIAIAAVSDLAYMRRRTTHFSQQLNTAAASVSSIRTQVTSLQRLAGPGRGLPVKLPQPLNVASILTWENKLASRQGVHITSLVFTPGHDPSPTQSIAQAFGGVGTAGSLHAYPIHVVAQGSQGAILAYLQSLVSGKPLVSISQVDFPRVSQLHTTVVINYEVYVYAPY